MKRLGWLLIGVLICAGCGKKPGLVQRLLTLKHLSDNQSEINQQLEDQKQLFEMLLKDARADQLPNIKKKEEFIRRYGEPVDIRMVVRDNQVRERWLYRYATEFFDSPKVYLFFDEISGLFLFFEVQEPQPVSTVSS